MLYVYVVSLLLHQRMFLRVCNLPFLLLILHVGYLLEVLIIEWMLSHRSVRLTYLLVSFGLSHLLFMCFIMYAGELSSHELVQWGGLDGLWQGGGLAFFMALCIFRSPVFWEIFMHCNLFVALSQTLYDMLSCFESRHGPCLTIWSLLSSKHFLPRKLTLEQYQVHKIHILQLCGLQK